MDPSTVSIASVSDMALSKQSRRHVPSMPMMQTPYPRLKATRSGALLSSDTCQRPPITASFGATAPMPMAGVLGAARAPLG